MIKKLLPTNIIRTLRATKDIIKFRKLKKEIIAYLRQQNSDELKEIEEYLEARNDLPVFPYSFIEKYKTCSYETFVEDGYPYVIHNGKKLYGPESWTKEYWEEYYKGLLCEQDEASPHCYMQRGRNINPGDIVADVGAAEGIFALDIIERARKIYLFECDDKWIIPLKKTFEPWKDKVEFVYKFVSDNTRGDTVALDDFFENKELTYLKADIEGAERLMLAGGEDSFKNKIRNCLLCCYHLPDDREVIEGILKEYGYAFEENPGYMIFKYDPNGLEAPYLRKGVVYGTRIQL